MKTAIVLVANALVACKQPPPQAPTPTAVSASTSTLPDTKKLGPFALNARTFDRAELFPNANIVHDTDLGIITIEGQRHELLSIITASPRTRNTAPIEATSITVPVRWTFDELAKARPGTRGHVQPGDATCTTDDEGETMWRRERSRHPLHRRRPDNEPEKKISITRMRGRAISITSWTPSKPIALVLGKTVSRKKHYPYIVVAARYQ